MQLRNTITPILILFILPLTIASLWLSGVLTGSHWLFNTIAYTSAGLIGSGLIYLLALFILTKISRRSRESLIFGMRKAWQLTLLTTVTTLVGQGSLILMLISLLFMEHSYRGLAKLFLAVAFGILVLLYNIIIVLFKKMPPYSELFFCRLVTKEDAPELWADVQRVASRLKTQIPDQIILGLTEGFFVTEAALKIGEKVVTGKSLYLAIPYLNRLNLEHALTIVGHEFGHFIGEDTVLSKEFYPQWNRHSQLRQLLWEDGWLARPAYYVSRLFELSIGSVESEFSRQRELIADKVGASIVNNQVAAEALVKAHVIGPSLYHAYDAWDCKESFLGVVQNIETKFSEDKEFVNSLTEMTTPHLFDSHPPLAMRIAPMGFTEKDIKNLNDAKVETSALSHWLGHFQKEIDALLNELANRIGQIQHYESTFELKGETEEEQKHIEEYFPEHHWSGGSFRFVSIGSVLFLTALFTFVSWELPRDFPFAQYSGVAFFITVGGVFTYKYARSFKGMYLKLNYEGIESNLWTRPISFSEIDEVSYEENNGMYYVKFSLNKSNKGLRNFPLWPLNSKKLSFWLSDLEGSSQEKVEYILAYFERYHKSDGNNLVDT